MTTPALQHIIDRQTVYKKTSHGWLRENSILLSSGARGYSVAQCTLNPNYLVENGGMIPCPRVDWVYRTIMWLYQHMGTRRLIIWYRNMED